MRERGNPTDGGVRDLGCAAAKGSVGPGRIAWFALLMAYGVMAGVPPAAAQGGAPEAGDASEATTAAESDAPTLRDDRPLATVRFREAPPLSATVFAPLRAAWTEVQSDLGREAWAEASGRVDHLVQIRTDLGVPNLYAFSSVLLHAARDASDAGYGDAAIDLAAAAGALSPDMASPHFAESRYVFEEQPLELSTHIKGLRNGIERYGTDVPATVAALGNAISAATLALVALLVLMALAMLARYFPSAANDLRRLFPPGVNRFQASLALATVLAAPAVAGFGLVPSACVCLAATALYMRTTERLVALVLLGGVALLPMGTRQIVRALDFPSSEASVLHRCATSMCDEEDRRQVRLWANTGVASGASNFVMALVLTRTAANRGDELSTAMRFAEVANDEEATADTETLLGNIAYFDALRECPGMAAGHGGSLGLWEQKLRLAINHWATATRVSPAHLPPRYNLSIAYRQLGDHESASQHLERAMGLDAEAVRQWNEDIAEENNLVRCQSTAAPNRHLMAPRLDAGELMTLAMSQEVPYDGIVMPFGGFFVGRFGTALAASLGALAMLLVLLAGVFGWSLNPTSSCLQCGAIADPATRLDLDDGAVCETCLHADVRRAVMDPKAQWFRERRLDAAVASRARRHRLVSWVAPGFGHLLGGRAVRGALFAGVVLTCVVVGLGLHAVAHDPRTPPGVGTARLVLFGSVGALTYVLALLDVHSLTARSR